MALEAGFKIRHEELVPPSKIKELAKEKKDAESKE